MFPPQSSNLEKPFPAKDTKANRSSLMSRNVTIAGHRTSVRLEPDMWGGLMEACRRERTSLHDLCTRVAQSKDGETSLTAAIRVYVMNYYRAASTEEGHIKAGHGSGVRMSAVPRAAASNMIGTAINTPPTMPQTQQMPPRVMSSPSPFAIGMNHASRNGTVR